MFFGFRIFSKIPCCATPTTAAYSTRFSRMSATFRPSGSLCLSGSNGCSFCTEKPEGWHVRSELTRRRQPEAKVCFRARAQVLILLGFAMVINSWILFVADMDKDGLCDIKEEYVGMYKTMTVVETIICMALPSIVILICNVLVIVKLNQHVRYRENNRVNRKWSFLDGTRDLLQFLLTLLTWFWLLKRRLRVTLWRVTLASRAGSLLTWKKLRRRKRRESGTRTSSSRDLFLSSRGHS